MLLPCTLVLSLLLVLHQSNAYKILVYSQKNGRSQVIYMGQLAEILIDAGHDVTLLHVEMDPEIKINGTNRAKIVTIPVAPKVRDYFSVDVIADTWTLDVSNPLAQSEMVHGYAMMMADQCRFTATHYSVFEELKKENFDLLVHELFDHCQLGFMQTIGVKNQVALQSTVLLEGVSEIIGVPHIPSIVPSSFSTKGNRMTLFERIINVVQSEISRSLISTNWQTEEEIYREKLGDKLVPFQDIIDQATFIITNGDPFLDFPHPLVSKVIELGGICVKKPQPLSKEWNLVLEKQEKAVLISFGSIAKSFSMPMHFKKAIAETIKSFPKVMFIWKYEKDDTEFLDGIDNVYTSKWVPQNDVLNHPNLKLFITHGGMNSILEACHRGVPVIGVPLFGDQMRNVRMVEALGSGTHFERLNLGNPNILKATIEKVLFNKSYEESAQRVAAMIANRPIDLKHSFVRHVEFAAKFGPVPNMTPISRHMSFFSYFMLDAVLLIGSILLLVILLVFVVLRRLVTYVFRLGTKQKLS